jgi:hypothetical protein
VVLNPILVTLTLCMAGRGSFGFELVPLGCCEGRNGGQFWFRVDRELFVTTKASSFETYGLLTWLHPEFHTGGPPELRSAAKVTFFQARLLVVFLDNEMLIGFPRRLPKHVPLYLSLTFGPYSKQYLSSHYPDIIYAEDCAPQSQPREK